MDGMTTYDAIADAFGFGEIKNYDWFTLGKVTAVDGTKLKVLLGGSSVPADCESYCYAQVGDVVLVVIMKGIARAIAKRGNVLSIPDSAVADASQAPSANQYGSALHVTDQQGEQVGYLGLVHDTNDNLWTQLGVTRDVNGSSAYNPLWLGLADDGTPIVSFGGVDKQQAWQKALNVLPLSGGEMTGVIVNKFSNGAIAKDVTTGTNQFLEMVAHDEGGTWFGTFQQQLDANRRTHAGMLIRNMDNNGNWVRNGVDLYVAKDGTPTVSFDQPAAWRTALGIGTVKELDVSSNVSVATSTDKSLGSLTLEAGKWVVEYGTFFSSASSGIACTYLFTSKDTGASSYWYRATCVQTAVSGSNTWHQGSTILNLTASTTVYLTVWHNTGSAKNCQGQMRAIKVG